MRNWGFQVCAALVVLAGSVHAADDPAAIIDKAIQASGGEAVLAKMKAEQWKIRGTIVMLGTRMPFVGDFYYQAPDMCRIDATIQFILQTTVSAGSDGKDFWQRTGGAVQEMPKNKAEALRQNLYVFGVCHLLDLKQKDFSLAAAEETKVNGKPAAGVKVSKKDRPDVTLWFDKTTSLLVKGQFQVLDDATNMEVAQEIFMSNYVKKDGRTRMQKMVVLRDGKLFLDQEIVAQKALDKLDRKLFVMPSR